jgi:hypothetical protein
VHKNALTRGANFFPPGVAVLCPPHIALLYNACARRARHAHDETSALRWRPLSITRRGLLTQLTSITTGGRGEIIARSRRTRKMKNGCTPGTSINPAPKVESPPGIWKQKKHRPGQAAFVIIFAHTLACKAKKSLVHTPLHMTQLQMVPVGAALIVALRRPRHLLPLHESSLVNLIDLHVTLTAT